MVRHSPNFFAPLQVPFFLSITCSPIFAPSLVASFSPLLPPPLLKSPVSRSTRVVVPASCLRISLLHRNLCSFTALILPLNFAFALSMKNPPLLPYSLRNNFAPHRGNF